MNKIVLLLSCYQKCHLSFSLIWSKNCRTNTYPTASERLTKVARRFRLDKIQILFRINELTIIHTNNKMFQIDLFSFDVAFFKLWLVLMIIMKRSRFYLKCQMSKQNRVRKKFTVPNFSVISTHFIGQFQKP